MGAALMDGAPHGKPAKYSDLARKRIEGCCESCREKDVSVYVGKCGICIVIYSDKVHWDRETWLVVKREEQLSGASKYRRLFELDRDEVEDFYQFFKRALGK